MTQTTAEAAPLAGVSPRTIRTWCQRGAVTASKVDGAWAVDTASLHRRIAIGRRTVAKQLAAFRDAESAHAKALELIEQAAIIPASRPGLYFAVSTDASHTYFVDVFEGSCTCRGHVYTGKCYHFTAAVMLETGTAATFALAA